VGTRKPFTAEPSAERAFGGYTIPMHTAAGWGRGAPRRDSGGAFIRQTNDEATCL